MDFNSLRARDMKFCSINFVDKWRCCDKNGRRPMNETKWRFNRWFTDWCWCWLQIKFSSKENWLESGENRLWDLIVSHGYFDPRIFALLSSADRAELRKLVSLMKTGNDNPKPTIWPKGHRDTESKTSWARRKPRKNIRRTYGTVYHRIGHWPEPFFWTWRK